PPSTAWPTSSAICRESCSESSMPHKVFTFDLRHPPQFATTGRDLYAAALDIIEWGEEQGFRRVALGEHHQSPDGYIPAPLLFASAIGGRTRRVRVQNSGRLGPLHEPVTAAAGSA